MVYFVIIRGPLGIGKSTISKELAKMLNADYISIDNVLEAHHLDKVPVNEECIPVDNFIKANKFVLSSIKQRLRNGKVVVFDGNFYHKEQIEDLIKKLDTNHFVFTLKAPIELCIKRDSERKKSLGIQAAKVVYNLVSKFDYGTDINVEGKTIKEILNEIVSYLF